MSIDPSDEKQDVLERNEELNNQVEVFYSSYARRKIVDSLLGTVIALLVGVIIVLGLINLNLDTDIGNSDVHQTQLICSQIPDRLHYQICRQVGLPQKFP